MLQGKDRRKSSGYGSKRRAKSYSLWGEGSRCLHRYTCSGAVCKHVFTPVRFGHARMRVIFRLTGDVLLASRLPQGAQTDRKDPLLNGSEVSTE